MIFFTRYSEAYKNFFLVINVMPVCDKKCRYAWLLRRKTGCCGNNKTAINHNHFMH